MATNIEIKAIIDDLQVIEEKVKKIATQFIGIDKQTDTYFITSSGRFKLRESEIDGSYLIPYLRPNDLFSKRSEYEKISVQNSTKTKYLFEKLLGIRCIVKKIRKIYLYENVRIHLDDVNQLGYFIELEAIYDGSSETEKAEIQKVECLMNALSINKEKLVAESYENLIQKIM